jgi:hypothetical protein
VEKLKLKGKQLPASKLSSQKKAKMLVLRVCEKSGKKRYCNTDFDRFPWCIYSITTHEVMCGICQEARNYIGIDKWNKSFDRYAGNGVKDCFLTGTKEWCYLANSNSKASERHEKSNVHGESILILIDNGSTSIQNELQKQFVPQHEQLQQQNQKFLAIVLHTIKFLASRKLPMFGDSSSEGLLVDTIKQIHGLHYPAVLAHLDSTRSSPLRKYTQFQYVNMFIDMMVDQVMEKKYNSLINAQLLSLIADECMNFLGFDQLDDIKGDTVAKSILETLKWRNHLSTDQL